MVGVSLMQAKIFPVIFPVMSLPGGSAGKTKVTTSAQAQLQRYLNDHKAHRVEAGFCYDSFHNPDFLSIQGIRDLIKHHIDPAFEPA